MYVKMTEKGVEVVINVSRIGIERYDVDNTRYTLYEHGQKFEIIVPNNVSIPTNLGERTVRGYAKIENVEESVQTENKEAI